VRNTGQRDGQEIIQLYVHGPQASRPRPERELRAFRKVALQPGEAQDVTFNLEHRDFASYDPDTGTWTVDGGQWDILIGASSRDIRLHESVTLEGDPSSRTRTRLTPLRAWIGDPATRPLVWTSVQSLAQSLGMEIDVDAQEDAFLNDFVLDMPIAKLVTMGHLTDGDLEQFIEDANGMR
jgi:beta-glucosidase